MDKLSIIISGRIGGDFNFFTGEVGGITYDEVVSMTNDFKGKEIDVKITSNGGSVDQSNAIHDLLKTHPANVTTTIIGTAKSAATKVAMAGDDGKRFITESSTYLIHPVQAQLRGSINDIQIGLDQMKVYNESIIDDYSNLTGIAKEDIKEMMDKDTIMNAKTAVDLGFVDSIVSSIDISNYSTEIQNEFQAVENETITPIDKLPKSVQKKLNISNSQNKLDMSAFTDFIESTKESLKSIQNSITGLSASDEAGNTDGITSLQNSFTEFQNSFVDGLTNLESSFDEKINNAFKGLDKEKLKAVQNIETENLATKDVYENITEGITNLSTQIAELQGKEGAFNAKGNQTPEGTPPTDVTNTRRSGQYTGETKY